MNGMENLFKTDFDPSQTSFKSNVKIGNDDNWTYTGMVDKNNKTDGWGRIFNKDNQHFIDSQWKD